MASASSAAATKSCSITCIRRPTILDKLTYFQQITHNILPPDNHRTRPENTHWIPIPIFPRIYLLFVSNAHLLARYTRIGFLCAFTRHLHTLPAVLFSPSARKSQHKGLLSLLLLPTCISFLLPVPLQMVVYDFRY